MAGKTFTRYFRDPEFRAAVDEQFTFADRETQPGVWITYAIHDPTREDHIGAEADGLIIYVGQTKEFGKRVRKRTRNAGIATRKPTDRIDGACYEIMRKGPIPRFSVRERMTAVIDSLVSETNLAKRLRARGYPLLNQWTEQKFGGRDISRQDVPHAWLWPITAADALGSGIELLVEHHGAGVTTQIDLSEFPPSMRLREIKAQLHVLMQEMQINSRFRLHVQ